MLLLVHGRGSYSQFGSCLETGRVSVSQKASAGGPVRPFLLLLRDQCGETCIVSALALFIVQPASLRKGGQTEVIRMGS